jgi:hypothetical protein
MLREKIAAHEVQMLANLVEVRGRLGHATWRYWAA